MPTKTFIGLSLALSLGVLACQDDGAGTDDAAGDMTESTDSTTSESGSTDADSTDTDSTDTTTSDTGSTDTGTTDGGGSLCTDACTVVAECGEDPLDECIADCEYLFETLGAEIPECVPPNEAVYECVAGLSCEEFQALLAAESPYPCEAEIEGLGECGDPGCELTAGGNLDGTSCEFSYHCTGEETYTVECVDGEGCDCAVDGEPVASCPDIALVCSAIDSEGVVDAVNECCGWLL
ncbi:MAG: hypothetical protein KC457_02290 [Myxococcales bacterium]|nr:hypothetical protein [Myxococcales bacterium]